MNLSDSSLQAATARYAWRNKDKQFYIAVDVAIHLLVCMSGE